MSFPTFFNKLTFSTCASTEAKMTMFVLYFFLLNLHLSRLPRSAQMSVVVLVCATFVGDCKPKEKSNPLRDDDVEQLQYF